LRIALDGTPLTVSTGGVARYTLALAVALAEEHPEDHYSLISDQHLPAIDGLAANLEVRTFASRRWWSAGLPCALVQANFDLFHGTDFAVPYLPIRPAVLTVHDLSPWLETAWQPGATRIRRRTPALLKTGVAKTVITPSETIRRAVIDRFGLPPGRVVAIPLAASSVFRPIDAQPPAIPYFLYVGTLEPRKNVFRLIDAWREVRRHMRVDLVLAGRIRADFTPPHPEHGLHVAGPVPDEDLASLYSRAAAVVYPSLYEGFGLPVLEAMQCGAFVITSRDPAILETTGGDAAVHVDANDERALAQALAAAFGDTSRIRERALARARRFSWQTTARKTREVYAAVSR